MNNYELVAAVQYLLEKQQSALMALQNNPKLSVYKITELSEEISEVETFIEMTREGYVE